MQLSSFDFKTRIYSVVVVLLFGYTEWVNCTSNGTDCVTLFLKGVF
jgi:hypothetical protein